MIRKFSLASDNAPASTRVTKTIATANGEFVVETGSAVFWAVVTGDESFYAKEVYPDQTSGILVAHEGATPGSITLNIVYA